MAATMLQHRERLFTITRELQDNKKHKDIMAITNKEWEEWNEQVAREMGWDDSEIMDKIHEFHLFALLMVQIVKRLKLDIE